MSGDEALSATVSLGVPLDVVLTVSVMLKHVVQLFHCESPVPKTEIGGGCCMVRFMLPLPEETLSCHDMSAN